MNLGPSITRTLVPVVVTALVNFLAVLGFGLTDDATKVLASVVAGVIGLAYYIGVRLIEDVWPQAGLLLGNPKKPVYFTATPVDAPVEDPDDEDDEPLDDSEEEETV